jgi:hypothetical protein
LVFWPGEEDVKCFGGDGWLVVPEESCPALTEWIVVADFV